MTTTTQPTAQTMYARRIQAFGVPAIVAAHVRPVAVRRMVVTRERMAR